MQSKPGPMLSTFFDGWKARGWSLEDAAGLRMEDPQADPPADPPTDPPADPPNEPLFPPHTPVADMTPAQQTEYWKHQARKHEQRASSRADYDAIKAKADQYDALAAASQTEQERAVAQAKEEGRTEAEAAATALLAPKLVDAEMRAAAAGKIDAEKLTALLDPIDRSKFLTDTGDVDLDKVATFIASVAPASTEGNGNNNGKTTLQNLGQGRRETGGKPDVSAGAERYKAKHPTKT